MERDRITQPMARTDRRGADFMSNRLTGRVVLPRASACKLA